jgi:hypothetical protein
MKIFELIDSALKMLDCGTGAGGFKEGNTCAGGGGGKGGSTPIQIAGEVLKEKNKEAWGQTESPKGGKGPLAGNARNPNLQESVKQAEDFWRSNAGKSDSLIEKMDQVVSKLSPEKRDKVASSVKSATERLANAFYHAYELLATRSDRQGTPESNRKQYQDRLNSQISQYQNIIDTLSK